MTSKKLLATRVPIMSAMVAIMLVIAIACILCLDYSSTPATSSSEISKNLFNTGRQAATNTNPAINVV